MPATSFPPPPATGSRYRLSQYFRVEQAGDPILPISLRSASMGASVGAFADVAPLALSGANTIPEALDRARYSAPSVGITYIDRDAVLGFKTFGEIRERARAVAQHLIARGIEPGDRVLLVIPTSFDFVECFLGTLMARAIAVPLYPPALMNRLDTYVERLMVVRDSAGAKMAIAPTALLPILGELALGRGGVRELLSSEETLRGTSQSVEIPSVSPDDLAFLQYTSGSTGHPKGVALTHANLVANIRAIGQAAYFTPKDVIATWLPLYHDMGLIGTLLSAIYHAVPLVMMSPLTFLQRPVTWLRAITDYGVTLSPAPNFAYARCVKRFPKEQLKKIDLSSWRCAMSGAEPVNVRTLLDFAQYFQKVKFRPDAFLPVYGLAEVTLAATFPTLNAPVVVDALDREALAEGRAESTRHDQGFLVIGVGKPMPGHRVRVVDGDGKLLLGRLVGHIQVAGPSVMQGYFNDPSATKKAIRGRWLHTGDIGYVADGNLFITGRSKDVIKIRGRNHYADDLEFAAERVPHVRAGSTVAFAVYDEVAAQERVVILCETREVLAEREEKEKLLEAVREKVGDVTGVVPDEVVLLPPGTVPKTSSGKRQRRKARELYLKGELKLRRTRRRHIAWAMTKGGVGLLFAKARGILTRLRTFSERPDEQDETFAPSSIAPGAGPPSKLQAEVEAALASLVPTPPSMGHSLLPPPPDEEVDDPPHEPRSMRVAVAVESEPTPASSTGRKTR